MRVVCIIGVFDHSGCSTEVYGVYFIIIILATRKMGIDMKKGPHGVRETRQRSIATLEKRHVKNVT